VNGDRYAGLHGLVDQLPTHGRWTAERRERWLEAVALVLDYSVAITPPKPEPEPEPEPEPVAIPYPPARPEPEPEPVAIPYPWGSATGGPSDGGE
jgi:hypothetical protein